MFKEIMNMFEGIYKKYFYTKPQSLGEGLARIKKRLGINANFENWSAIPGKRKYVSLNKTISFDTYDVPAFQKKYEGIRNNTDTSRLVFSDNSKKEKLIVDYNTHHDNLGIEITPYRYRTVSRLQNIDHKVISEPTMFL